MILFVAHDPGPKNHIIPFHRYAMKQGYGARFVDLAEDQVPRGEAQITETLKADRVALIVTGCSTNQTEWEWIQTARRNGVRSAMMIDIGVGTCLEHVDPLHSPDRFLVTNEFCVSELAKGGFPAARACVTGSPHLEYLAEAAEGLRLRSAEVKEAYGVSPAERCAAWRTRATSCHAERVGPERPGYCRAPASSVSRSGGVARARGQMGPQCRG